MSDPTELEVLKDQTDRLLTIAERQQKRIHNLECMLMILNEGKVNLPSQVGEETQLDIALEQFFEANGSMGAFLHSEFLHEED